MAIIYWNDTYYVNIEEVDEQHQHLVEIINNLADAMAEGKGKEVLGSIIEKLIDYTVRHFRSEERIFRLVNYPDAKNHMIEHAEFIKKVTRFKEDFLNDRLGLTVEVMNFLCDWLRDHIKNNDKKLGQYIQESRSAYC